MKRLLALTAAMPLLLGMAPAPDAAPDPAAALGPTLAHVRAQAAGVGETIWPGYGSAPFEFLLLLPDREVLLCRTAPTGEAGFTPDGTDAATGCGRQVRPRGQLPGNLLAAMPLFGLPSTIVMGTPETTGYSKPGSWVRTIYHEHFHQYQLAHPGYLEKVEALDLKGGDTTGMWMLNYAFPYDRPDVVAAFNLASLTLADAVEARGTPDFLPRFLVYLTARRAFQKTLSEQDFRYFDFQLWQEGVARWTEIAVAAADSDPDVKGAAARLEAATIKSVRHQDLAGDKRVVVYAYGAAEAMLMQACGPQWRAAYFDAPAMSGLITAAWERCRK